jgi:hypothetical protein
MKTLVLVFLAIMFTSTLAIETDQTFLESTEGVADLEGELVFLQALDCRSKCSQTRQECPIKCKNTYTSHMAISACSTSCDTNYKLCYSRCL